MSYYIFNQKSVTCQRKMNIRGSFVHKDKIGIKVNENAIKERKWGNEINFMVSIYID